MFAMLSDDSIIRLALKEDIGKGDITTRSLKLKGRKGKAVVIAKGTGIISGIDLFRRVFKLLSADVFFRSAIKNGERVHPGDRIIIIGGPLDALLTGERTALNIISHLSGVATLTAQFVSKIKDLDVRILDTRKTMPGMRDWEKRAVIHGGGQNHRRGLYDMYLIKENHISAAGGLEEALRLAEKHRGKTGARLQVEVRNLDELKRAMKFAPDYILLDNFDIARIRRAVKLAGESRRKIILEASGNIKTKNVRSVALAGVDRVSIGSLTHSAPSLDLSFRIMD